MIRYVLITSILVLLAVTVRAAGAPQGPADLIIHHAKVVTVDAEFHIVQAVAVKDGRILAVGDNESIVPLKGPKTRLIDGDSHTVLPGLYSHVHPVDAALSELREPLPVLKSLRDVFAHIRKQATKTPEGEWIVVRLSAPAIRPSRNNA